MSLSSAAVAPPEDDSQEFAASAECSHATSPPKSGGDLLRCECGSLLARYVGGGVELKCRRCKRTVIVPVTAALEETAEA